jgi:UDPglucose 6-dehydrogenase
MNNNIIIGICGLGFVGNAIHMTLKNFENIELYTYDLYKENGNINDLFKCNIIFLCLPTPYDDTKKEFSKIELENTLEIFNSNNYNGVVLIKSTIEPTTTNTFCDKYKNLSIIHNPEFLTARTAVEDFKNQQHIILGIGKNCTEENKSMVIDFYKKYFNDNISICESNVSESVKIFCNSFYSVKIQFFTELFLTCDKLNINFNETKNIMLKNNWINPMHTNIPGHDNKISYGGMCFPKDTNALNSFMEKNNIPHEVLNATINERNKLRNDYN